MSNSKPLFDISIWEKSLQRIPENFKKSITNLISFKWYDWEDNFMMSTNEKKTYIYGDHISRLIALPYNPNKPQLIEMLNNKIIKQVDHGTLSFVILTDDGQVYMGGGDEKWQTNHSLKLIANFIEKICCGHEHLLLLTDDNKLMAMGWNRYAQITGGSDSYDKMVDTGLTNVMKMACAWDYSLAVTHDYKAYSWGSNYNGQVGLNDRHLNQYSPTLIEYFDENNILIKDIVARFRCSFFLSTFGELYGFGYDLFSGLEINDYNKNTYVPFKFSICNFKDIISDHDFFMASTDDQSYYSWGIYSEGGKFKKIMQPVKNFIEASKLFFKSPFTFGWISIDNPTYISIEIQQKRIQIIENMFDNPANYDFVFQFSTGQKIYAHRKFVSDSCDYLKTLLSEDKWCKEDHLLIESYSYEIFYAYIRLLYFGEIDFNQNNISDLLQLADCYLNKNLFNLCKNYLIKTLNDDNKKFYQELARTYKFWI